MIEALRRLRDLGNTVIVIEHDLEMIAAADCPPATSRSTSPLGVASAAKASMLSYGRRMRPSFGDD